MKTVGVRELHQNTSEWLRYVKAGETLEVTEHGRPVAVITPIATDETPLERMIREGRARPAKGDLRKFLNENPPLPLEDGKPAITEMLLQEREDERY